MRVFFSLKKKGILTNTVQSFLVGRDNYFDNSLESEIAVQFSVIKMCTTRLLLLTHSFVEGQT